MVKGATCHNSDTFTTLPYHNIHHTAVPHHWLPHHNSDTFCVPYHTIEVAHHNICHLAKEGRLGSTSAPQSPKSQQSPFTSYNFHTEKDTCPGSQAQLARPIERNQPVSYQTTSRNCGTLCVWHKHVDTYTYTTTHTNTLTNTQTKDTDTVACLKMRVWHNWRAQ